MEIIEGLVIGTVMGYILLFCMIGGVLSVLPTILLGAFYVLMAIIAVVSFIALCLSLSSYDKIGAVAPGIFLALSLGGILCMANRETISDIRYEFQSEEAKIAAANTFLEFENRCATETVDSIQVRQRYRSIRKWDTVWSATKSEIIKDTHIPLRNGTERFLVRIITHDKRDTKFEDEDIFRLSHIVYFARDYIETNGEKNIKISYDGSRILVHNDKVKISDDKTFKANTMIRFSGGSDKLVEFSYYDGRWSSYRPVRIPDECLTSAKKKFDRRKSMRLDDDSSLPWIEGGSGLPSNIKLLYYWNIGIDEKLDTIDTKLKLVSDGKETEIAGPTLTVGGPNLIDIADNKATVSHQKFDLCKFDFYDPDIQGEAL